MIDAHILSPGPAAPRAAAWAVAGVAIAAFGLAVVGPPRWRRPAWAVGAAAAVAVLVLGVLAPAGAPAAPPLTIRLANPAPGATVTSPVTLTVCGRQAGGASTPLPGEGRVLSYSIDGVEVASGSRDTVSVEASAGLRRVHVELLTADHVRYQPAVAVDATITITGPGPVTSPAACEP